MMIKFLGGPFDGHKQSGMDLLDELPPTLALPVNVNNINRVSGLSLVPNSPTTSIAIYDLHEDNLTYYFLGSCPPELAKMEKE